MRYNLQERATQIYKDHDHNQTQWINAINYLRKESKQGWLLDKNIPHKGKSTLSQQQDNVA